MHVRNKKLFTIAAIGGILAIANLFLFHTSFFGILGLFLVFIAVGKRLGRFPWSFLQTLALFILLTTGAYYLVGITRAATSVILAIPLLLFFFGKGQDATTEVRILPAVEAGLKPACRRGRSEVQSPYRDILAFFVLALDLVLLSAMWAHRTEGLLASPWTPLDVRFFGLFALSSFLLFVVLYRSKNAGMNVALASLHLFVMSAVAATMYPLGFGFDAFVHRATEMWIQAHGSILPKQPYYIGQYSFVVWLSNLTRIPIFFIDVYLVPVLAALAIPATVILLPSCPTCPQIALAQSHGRRGRGGHDATGVPGWWEQKTPNTSALALWLIPFIPFLSLHLTTPHNLVLLLAILAAMTAFAAFVGDLSIRIPLLLAAAAVVTHPLLGAPLLLWILAAMLLKTYANKKSVRRVLPPVTALAILFLIPNMFTFQIMRTGGTLPTLTDPLKHFSDFIALFARPYWYAVHTPWRFELLYAWQSMIAPVALLLCLVGIILFIKKEKRWDIPALFLAGSIGLFGSAFLLRSWVVFPDVVAYEQGDYPLRLVKASIIFLLPFGMYAVSCIMYHVSCIMRQQKNATCYMIQGTCTIVAAILLTLSLYLSYPQRNVKARFPGFNVTRSDFNTVEWIHKQDVRCQMSDVRCGIDYIVLSNQLVSAAALTEYSFAKYFDTPSGPLFYYSLPTGGPLYQDYGRMLYQGQKREYMEHAMDLAGVKTSYFVVNRYWANADKIIEGAKKTADSWQVIDGGEVFVFEYKRYPPD